MATSRPFTYNPNQQIPGTEKFGDLTVGFPTYGFESTGLQWWNGPDEELGYVIAQTNVDNNVNPLQPTQIPNVYGSVGFFRTDGKNTTAFINLTNAVSGQNFTTATQCKTWLESNNRWTSWSDFATEAIVAFKTRVLGDSGNFEAETNLKTQLNTLGSDLFDSASLIITPNAYKEQTLYSIKPDKIGNNLLLWSEQFDNSYWRKTSCSIVPNQEIAPNGTLTADYVVEDNTTGLRYVGRIGVPTSIGQTYTFSIFVKKKDRSQIMFQINEGDSLYPTVKFDFDSQSFIQTTPRLTSSFQSVGNGWFRIILTRTPTTGTSSVIGIHPTDINGNYGGIGDGVSRTIIWGAQVELGSTATDYISTTDRAIVNGTIGDLTVTRATTATRVNEQGLIETVPYNILSYSEEISNNLWSKSDGSGTRVIVIENQGVSPRGDLTADLVVPTTDYKEHAINPVISLSSLGINRVDALNWSTYVKPAGNNFFILRTNINNSWVSTIFNIQNGTIVSTHPNFASSNIANYGNGWYRISVVTQNMTNYDSFQMISSPTSDITFSGDGVSGAYIWGSQITKGEELKKYYPTTNLLNVPRIDYTNGSPAILVEPQRTNLLLRSQEFDNAYWTVFGSLTQRLANQTIAPDGTLTANLLGFDGVGTRLLRKTSITTNNNTTYSISLFVKNNTFTQNDGTLKLVLNNNTSSPNNFMIGATINFQTETLTINQSGTQGTGINGSAFGNLLVLPNGWYRIQVTGTMGSAAGNSITSFEIGTYNQAGSCFVWGAQLELGSSVTSYIPTTTATVTRNADVISNTNAYNLIGQTEGSVYLELSLAKLNKAGSVFFSFSLNNTNWVRFRIQNDSLLNINIQTEWYVNSVFVNQGNANIPRSTSLNKILFTYKIGSQVNFYHNGIKLTATNPIITQIPAFTTIELGHRGGGSQINEGIKTTTIYKTALTDAQAIKLTTL